MMTRTMRPPLKTIQGFTLIELMIVLAVVGILAAIAYPSYTEQVARGRRAQAKSQLLAAQQWMERFYSDNYRYDQNSAGTATDDSTQFGARFSTSPPAGEGAAMYNIALVTPLAQNSFTVKATRKTGSPMASDKCGDLTIDDMGRKSIVSGTYSTAKFASITAAIAACWN